MNNRWHKMPGCKSCGCQGFTLVEFVMTLMLLLVLGITAATRINLEQRDLDTIARVLNSNLQLAQELAMTQGSTYGFHVRSSTQYEIFAGSAGNVATNPYTNSDFLISISPIQFAPIPSDISFDANGRPNINNDASITLIGGGGGRTITVQQGTGFMMISTL